MSQSDRGMKSWLQSLPMMPELYWQLIRRRTPANRRRIHRLGQFILDWVGQASQVEIDPPFDKQQILFFANVPIWLKHSSLLASAFSGLGHQVTLAYLPYEDWFSEQNDFQIKLRDLQLKEVFQAANGHFQAESWYKLPETAELPNELIEAVEAVCERDYQYTHQVEVVDKSTDFYEWRRKNNFAAAVTAWQWLSENRPDVVVVPNGLILEFGAVFEVARYLDIPTVTYEFGEQKDRIWLTRNQPVMFQDTDEIWEAVKNRPLTTEQDARIKELYASRMEAGLWQNFSRQWQDAPTEGGDAVREKLGLDDRPLILLAANVIGDSLTLGRQVFSETMTEWIERTLVYYTDRPEVQFALRIHPGERYTDGPSVEDIVRRMIPQVPDHFRIISASDPINSYDLISAADLGIVYTTTVGMEMAMFGLPAVVVGKTHYRNRGFTHDPESWEQYFNLLDQAQADLKIVEISHEQVNLAWQYAYYFFFEYPRPFPWHLRNLDEDIRNIRLDDLLADPLMGGFRSTFDLLRGKELPWQQLIGQEG